MAVMDEFKEQRESLKEKSAKEKWNYFWDYYKIHVFVVIGVLVFGGILIKDIVTSKDIAFYAALLNSFPSEQEEEFMDGFGELAGIDLNEYEVFLDTSLRFDMNNYDPSSMAATQKLLAMVSAGEIDVIVADRDTFANYASNEMFGDIRAHLTPEQITDLESHFFYYDYGLPEEEIDYNAIANSEPVDYTDTVDRRNPEEMIDPIPVGIFLDDDLKTQLVDAGFYGAESEILFGIVGNSQNTAYSQAFLEWLTKKPIVE